MNYSFKRSVQSLNLHISKTTKNNWVCSTLLAKSRPRVSSSYFMITRVSVLKRSRGFRRWPSLRREKLDLLLVQRNWWSQEINEVRLMFQPIERRPVNPKQTQHSTIYLETMSYYLWFRECGCDKKGVFLELELDRIALFGIAQTKWTKSGTSLAILASLDPLDGKHLFGILTEWFKPSA